ncbi:MAG: SCO family protein [Anaerolineales bacterium]|nr:SCO family protein [Anaerolineales bacterium]
MDKKLFWIGNGILLVLIVAVTLTILLNKPPSFRGTLYGEPLPPAPEFTLTKADGATFRMSDQRGKIVMLFFGYTSCPDVCPTTLAELKQVVDKLGEDGERVQVVFVSVDPKRDTPERIQAYAAQFNPTFLGLSGTMDELSPIWSEYSIWREEAESDSAAGTIVNHTARLFLIDPQGNLRLSYVYGAPLDDIVHDAKLVLKQKP